MLKSILRTVYPMRTKGSHELLPNKATPNVKIPNRDLRNNPENILAIPFNFLLC